MKAVYCSAAGWGALMVLAGSTALAQAPASAPAQTAAAPHHAHRHHRRHVALRHAQTPSLPGPAQPPAPQVAAGTTPAPVPNEDIGPPSRQLDAGGNVTPGAMSIHYPPVGDGYLPGSSSTDMDNRTTPAVPGLQYQAPIQNPAPQSLPAPGAGP